MISVEVIAKRQVDLLANLFREFGVEPGDRVDSLRSESGGARARTARR